MKQFERTGKLLVVAMFILSFAAPNVMAGVYDDFSNDLVNHSLWNVRDSGHILSQSNGLLNVNGPPNAVYGNMGSTYTFHGDFVFVLDYRDFQTSATQFSGNSPQISLQVTDSAAPDSNFIFIFRGYGATGHNFFSSAKLNGSGVQGYNAPAASPSGLLKISRTGSAITTYYNEGSTWLTLGNFPQAFAGDVTVQVGAYSGDNGTFHVSSDWVGHVGGSPLPKGGQVTVPTRTITVDGDPGDWDGINPVATYPRNIADHTYTGDDIMSLYIAQDTDNLYLRMDLWDNVNTNFWNYPPPNNGRYAFSIDGIQNAPYGNLYLGIAYDATHSQWSLGFNGSGDYSGLSGPQFVGVRNNIIELKVPLYFIGGYSDYEVSSEVNNCCTATTPNNKALDNTNDVRISLVAPTIKANNSVGSIVVPQDTPLSITVNLDSGSMVGHNSDWWVAAQTPFGWYSYAYPTGWLPGINPSAQTPLFNISSPYYTLNSVLPAGDYTFYFGVDLNPDRILNSPLYYDAVNVHVGEMPE